MKIEGNITTDRDDVPTGFDAKVDFDAWDYFAGQALAGQCANEGMEGMDAKLVAGCAGEIADAMMLERAKRREGK